MRLSVFLRGLFVKPIKHGTAVRRIAKGLSNAGWLSPSASSSLEQKTFNNPFEHSRHDLQRWEVFSSILWCFPGWKEMYLTPHFFIEKLWRGSCRSLNSGTVMTNVTVTSTGHSESYSVNELCCCSIVYNMQITLSLNLSKLNLTKGTLYFFFFLTISQKQILLKFFNGIINDMITFSVQTLASNIKVVLPSTAAKSTDTDQRSKCYW